MNLTPHAPPLLRHIAARRTAIPPPRAEHEGQFAEVERYLHGEPELALGQQCGLKAKDFPSAELLTEAQQGSLLNPQKPHPDPPQTRGKRKPAPFPLL